MSVFLLLVGLALFISGAAMYFTHAARNEPRWVFSSLLFPFVVPLYYRRNWNELYMAAFVQSTGLAMAVAGGLMLAFQSERPAGLVEQQPGLVSSATSASGSGFVDSERALQLLVRQGPGTPLAGRVHGKAFTPDRVEFIDDTLRLIEGRALRPTREIAIRFPVGTENPANGLKRAFAPDGDGLPEVQLSWQDAQGQPITEVFRSGYRLELDIAPVSRSKLSGYIQMMLPDRLESYVGGDVTVLTSHLRYIGGEVDRRYDHEETLLFVAEEYVRTQYAEPDIDVVSFSAMQMDALEGSGRTDVVVTLKDGRVGRHIVVLAKSDAGWYAKGPDSTAATAAAGHKAVYALVVPVAKAATVVEATRAAAAPVRKPVVRTLEFAELGSLDGKGAVVEYRSGRREQGVLRGMRKDRLVLEAQKGGGVVEYLVSADELLQLQMNSGEIIRLAGAAAVAATPTTVSPAAASPVQPLMVGDRDISRYLNRTVKVVASSGKETVGVLRGLNKDGLVIETLVGGGKMDHIVPVAQFVTIDFATP